jgi:hypothetical protein
MPSAMLGEDERAFFSAVAGLLPTIFLAAILQREGTKERHRTPPASEASEPSKPSKWWEAEWLTTLVFLVAIFLMLAGELAAFHVLRTNQVHDQDYAFVSVATVLLVGVVVGRVIRARTPSESTVVVALIVILGGLGVLWFAVL